jgi:hypothetical protein
MSGTRQSVSHYCDVYHSPLLCLMHLACVCSVLVRILSHSLLQYRYLTKLVFIKFKITKCSEILESLLKRIEHAQFSLTKWDFFNNTMFACNVVIPHTHTHTHTVCVYACNLCKPNLNIRQYFSCHNLAFFLSIKLCGIIKISGWFKPAIVQITCPDVLR